MLCCVAFTLMLFAMPGNARMDLDSELRRWGQLGMRRQLGRWKVKPNRTFRKVGVN